MITIGCLKSRTVYFQWRIILLWCLDWKGECLRQNRLGKAAVTNPEIPLASRKMIWVPFCNASMLQQQLSEGINLVKTRSHSDIWNASFYALDLKELIKWWLENDETHPLQKNCVRITPFYLMKLHNTNCVYSMRNFLYVLRLEKSWYRLSIFIPNDGLTVHINMYLRENLYLARCFLRVIPSAVSLISLLLACIGLSLCI